MSERRKVFFQTDPDGKIQIPVEVQYAIDKCIEEKIKESACKCDLDEKALKELPHFMGMVKDVGNRNLATGVENIRENHKYIIGLRSYSHKVADYIIKTVIGAIVIGALVALWSGFLSKIFKGH